jgi:cell division septation protein DedD
MNSQLSTAVAPPPAALSMFQSAEMFDLVLRQADYVSKSDMIPKEFRGKPENCAIAIEIAGRLGASWFMIMQSLDVIQGRPSWRAQFLMGMINSCGRFGPLQFDMQVTGPEKMVVLEFTEKEGFGPNAKHVTKKLNYTYIPTTCVAYATSKVTGEVVRGPSVSYDMAIEEGWVSKAGSKWQTPMRELMLTYRAGSFFARVHASDLTLGMHTAEEVRDMGPIIEVESSVTNLPQTTAPQGNPYATKAQAEPQPESKAPAQKTTRAAKSTPAPTPAKEEPAAASTDPAAPARGFRAFYEKIEVKNGESNGKPWKKYTLHYSIPGGAIQQANTFSDSIVSPLENADEGVQIAIETTPNPNPKYAPTLTFLELIHDPSASEATGEVDPNW